MKEYYFLKGKDQNGPFSIEHLADKELTAESLIWTDGMENWQMLKDIPELVQALNPKPVPPPPPNEVVEKISKTEVSGQLKVTTEKTPNPTLESIKPTKPTLKWLIVWLGFHLFALLMSYSCVDVFNKHCKQHTDKFWPFVTFMGDFYGGPRYMENFKGIFYNYDWSEFAFYVGGAMITYLLVRISNKGEEKKVT